MGGGMEKPIMKTYGRLTCFLSLLACLPGFGKNFPAADDWPWWRGPARDGVARGTEAPVKWSATTNIVWKATVPGRGHSSPTVIGSLVVLQTSDEQAKTQSVVAFARKTGKKLWQTTINSGGFPAFYATRSPGSFP